MKKKTIVKKNTMAGFNTVMTVGKNNLKKRKEGKIVQTQVYMYIDIYKK